MPSVSRGSAYFSHLQLTLCEVFASLGDWLNHSMCSMLLACVAFFSSCALNLSIWLTFFQVAYRTGWCKKDAREKLAKPSDTRGILLGNLLCVHGRLVYITVKEPSIYVCFTQWEKSHVLKHIKHVAYLGQQPQEAKSSHDHTHTHVRNHLTQVTPQAFRWANFSTSRRLCIS